MAATTLAPPRRAIMQGDHFPGGRGLLLAWDCRTWRNNESSSFLFRAGDAFVLLHSYPGREKAQVRLVDVDEARGIFNRFRMQVVDPDEAFAGADGEMFAAHACRSPCKV